MDVLSMVNDPTYTPIGSGTNDLLAGSDSDDPGFFLVVATTLRNRRPFGRIKYWLSTPYRLVRGGGRP